MHYETIVDVAAKIRSRRVSAVELTRHMLERIDSLDGSLHSYATVTGERAMQAAQQAEEEIAAGQYRGPLHGIPLAVKDLCYTRGIPTMGGLAVRRDFVPNFDATVVERLDAAGAVILGKLNLTEGAMAGYHPDFNVPVNPWREDLWSGASSSGSGVATAAGLCFSGIGSDTGGSIRFPSLANGVVGLKPTYGLVSRHGVLALGDSLDHVGPLARCVEDAALVLQAIAGHDPSDPTSLDSPPLDLDDLHAGVGGLRIGYDPEYAAADAAPELVAALESALGVFSDLGAEIVQVTLPSETLTLGDVWFPICSYEACRAHEATYPARRDEYGAYFRDFLDIGAAVTDDDYASATAIRAAFTERYLALLDDVDALLCSAGGVTFPANADPYGDFETLASLFGAVQMHQTIPADFSGVPGLTVPCGFTDDGIPLAFQLVGARLSESRLCRIGQAYENATRWHERHPNV